jgi:DNA-binding FadR family transcriptional regulator
MTARPAKPDDDGLLRYSRAGHVPAPNQRALEVQLFMPARPTRIDEVRQGLLADLVTGAKPLGTKLPNEQALAARFGVSRATVREAVGGLVESGYLLRRHGSDTYVTSLPTRLQPSMPR